MNIRNILIGVGVLAVALIVWAAIAIGNEKKECLDSGGSWEFSHYMPVITYVNNVAITNLIPVHECRWV